MANILNDLTVLIGGLGFEVSTAMYRDKAPAKYVVITPTRDEYWGYADNYPSFETQGADISLFTDANYMADKDKIVNAVMHGRYKVQARQYYGIDNDAGLHHYVVSVEKVYHNV
jgi:hypothetical protein